MPDIIEAFTNWLSSFSPFLSYPLAFLPFWGWLNWVALIDKKKPDSRRLRFDWLREDKFGQLYLSALAYLLDKTANLIGDRTVFNHTQPLLIQKNWITRTFGFNPWTEASYKACLIMAAIYPFSAFLLFWIAGSTGKFNMQIDIDGINQVTASMRFFLLFYICICIKGLIWILKQRKKHIIINLLIFILFNHFILAITFEDKFALARLQETYYHFLIVFLPLYLGGWLTGWLIYRSHKDAHKLIFTFSLVVAFIFAFKGYSIFINAIAIPLFVVLYGAFAIVGFMSIVGTEYLVGIISFFSFFSFVGAIYVALYTYYTFLCKTNGSIGVFWSSYTLIFLCFIFLLLGWRGNEAPIFMLMFYTLLPLINAPIDWLSLGVTRGLLQAIRSSHHSCWQSLSWALIDLVLALVFLLLISALTIISISMANLVTGTIVFDLKAVIDGMRSENNPLDYYWIYFMLLSTLIPTLVHFALVGGSAALWAPVQLRNWIVTRCDQNHDKIILAWIYLTFTPFVGFLLVPYALLYSLYWLVSTHNGTVFMVLLDSAEWLTNIF